MALSFCLRGADQDGTLFHEIWHRQLAQHEYAAFAILAKSAAEMSIHSKATLVYLINNFANPYSLAFQWAVYWIYLPENRGQVWRLLLKAFALSFLIHVYAGVLAALAGGWLF